MQEYSCLVPGSGVMLFLFGAALCTLRARVVEVARELRPSRVKVLYWSYELLVVYLQNP